MSTLLRHRSSTAHNHAVLEYVRTYTCIRTSGTYQWYVPWYVYHSMYTYTNITFSQKRLEIEYCNTENTSTQVQRGHYCNTVVGVVSIEDITVYYG
jgi:hypothetical protein